MQKLKALYIGFIFQPPTLGLPDDPLYILSHGCPMCPRFKAMSSNGKQQGALLCSLLLLLFEDRAKGKGHQSS